MSNIIDDNGNAIQGTAREVGKCAITFKGTQNRLTFGKGVTIENATIAFSGSNGSLQIDDNAKVIGMFNIGDGCHIRIGKETKFNKPCRFITQEGAGISIGSRCLLANVKFRTSDSHSIIDVVSGQRINPAKEIVIGNNVWIAEDVKVYKGGFPAQYGGRLSSVIDVKLNEGNNQKFSGTGGIGLIASRLTLEAPLVKDKSSIIISGRRTYADLITKAINQSNKDNEDYSPIPDYYFYDFNTKVNYQLSERDRIYLSGYFGRDAFGFNDENFNFNFNWGNATGTARWNRLPRRQPA